MLLHRTDPAADHAAPADVPTGHERLVGIHADDLAAARPWALALAGEGLRVHVQVMGDAAPVASDAVVVHVSGQLAAQLGRLRSLRARAPRTPLLLAVHALRDLDQVLGLEMGADDAVDLALSPPVIAARLRALWRRGTWQHEPQPVTELRFGRLALSLLQRQARLDDRVLPLTEGEFEVLWLLASQAGQAVSRRDLLLHVRGLDDQPMDRSIDSRIYRLRAKLGDAHAARQRLRTVRHHGYVFCPVGW